MTSALPHGDLFLFGGVLRDVALYGTRGFNSDIDIVVEGDWGHCVRYLQSAGATRNKFGGYRIMVANWPIDIWNASETWAIREGLVSYHDISSLTLTTVLNWDAILMNWRTGGFVCRPNYLEDLTERRLDVVLSANPNPLGTVVRIFRHLCMKDAKQVTGSAARFLSEATRRYSFEEVRAGELRSYGASEIAYPIYRFFQHLSLTDGVSIGERYGIAVELLLTELPFGE